MGFDMMCLDHVMLTNLVYNWLSQRGFTVYLEVPLNVQPVNILAPSITDKGSLSTTAKQVRHTALIDVVAIKGSKVIGYEVKSNKQDVIQAISSGQLSNYIDSGCFDEVYLVVPEEYCGDKICNFAQGYAGYLRQIGLGLICVDKSHRFNIVIPARTHNKNNVCFTDLHGFYNEAMFKQDLINYLRNQGYEVYAEVRIPKLPKSCIDDPKRSKCINKENLTKCRDIMGRLSSPARYLNRIDLIAVKDDCTPSKLVCGNCDTEILGIEVKCNKAKLPRSEVNKLKEYIASGVITKLIVAVDHRSNVNEITRQTKGIADVLYMNNNRKFQLIRNQGPRCTPCICALVFQAPSQYKITIYDFCDLCCQKTEINLRQQHVEFVYSDLRKQKEIIRKLLVGECCGVQEVSKCCVIFIRRSRGGHVFYVFC